jgi:hypothetical protein
VSVARALGDTEIEAHVIEVLTRMRPDRELRLRDLPLKHQERVFHERIPLPREARARIQLSDEWRYAELAMLIEAWGFRASQAAGRLLSREETAARWLAEDFEPMVQALHDADVGGPGTDAEQYLRIATLRYLLLYTHEWTEELLERLFAQEPPPGSDEDTMVHRIRRELG